MALRSSFTPEAEGFYKHGDGFLLWNKGSKPANCDFGGLFVLEDGRKAMAAVDGIGSRSGPAVQRAVNRFGQLLEDAPVNKEGLDEWVNRVELELSDVLRDADACATAALMFEVEGGVCAARIGDARYLIASDPDPRVSTDGNLAVINFSRTEPAVSARLAAYLRGVTVSKHKTPRVSPEDLRRLSAETTLSEQLVAELASFGPDGNQSYAMPNPQTGWLQWEFVPVQHPTWSAVMSDGISVSTSMDELAKVLRSTGTEGARKHFEKHRGFKDRLPFALPSGQTIHVNTGGDNRILVAVQMGGWAAA